jgi:hypothetical protein
MKVVTLAAAVGILALSSPARAVDQVVNLPECLALTIEDLHALALHALDQRRYNVEENTPTMIVGAQKELKVELVLEPSKITIRWKDGFAGKNDTWLRNLKTDVLWRLVE